MILPKRISMNLGISGLMLLYIMPLLLVVLASFKSNSDVVNNPVSLIFTPTLDAYRRVFDSQFLLALWNSVIIATGATILTLLLAVPISYVLSRARSVWTALIIGVLIGLQMLPVATAIIPQYRVLAGLGLLGSVVGVIMAMSASALPFAILIVRPFFLSVPYEVEEAAYVDGAGRIRTLIQIVFPLVRNGCSVVAVLLFISSWGEFLYPISFLNEESKFPLSYLLVQQQGFYGTQWNNLMALALLGAIPTTIVFALVARKLTTGLALGSVK